MAWSLDPKENDACRDAIRRVALLHGPERHLAALKTIHAGIAFGRSADWMATVASAALDPRFFREEIARESQAVG
jgi:hypothetical protein